MSNIVKSSTVSHSELCSTRQAKSLGRASTNDGDFSISANGHGYMSQRLIERTLGLSSGTISKHIKKSGSTYKLNENNQLSAESLVVVSTYYSKAGYLQASDFLGKLAEAGAEVFIRGMMGISSVQAQLEEENADLKLELLENKKGIDTHAKNKLLKKWVRHGWLDHRVKSKHEYKLTYIGSKYLIKVNSHFEEM
jgi:hypothetical protein